MCAYLCKHPSPGKPLACKLSTSKESKVNDKLLEILPGCIYFCSAIYSEAVMSNSYFRTKSSFYYLLSVCYSLQKIFSNHKHAIITWDRVSKMTDVWTISWIDWCKTEEFKEFKNPTLSTHNQALAILQHCKWPTVFLIVTYWWFLEF